MLHTGIRSVLWLATLMRMTTLTLIQPALALAACNTGGRDAEELAATTAHARDAAELAATQAEPPPSSQTGHTLIEFDCNSPSGYREIPRVDGNGHWSGRLRGKAP